MRIMGSFIKTNDGMKIANARRGEQTYRGKSRYHRRFYQSFQTTPQSTDKRESFEEEEDRESSFGHIDKSFETSSCYYAEELEMAESRGEEKK